jgi:hypothetical protein
LEQDAAPGARFLVAHQTKVVPYPIRLGDVSFAMPLIFERQKVRDEKVRDEKVKMKTSVDI